ncbi:MAG TPA: hypothetical protein VHS52_06390 [Acidimicrobiales bacterium]|jgi:hypothetical protein|nr:hypothetical protein [Acidimicrobiales bacterium]
MTVLRPGHPAHTTRSADARSAHAGRPDRPDDARSTRPVPMTDSAPVAHDRRPRP